ncbi:hypothetical protein MSG28_008232 [Choristoneura fumiferana]|uniref:Uncharacterized protein n=1 Tax=Choristoneura fumiferana TaxID=7141 RepID=A0ACC0JAI1_CHOFU|nr:hypothetical protein MSG28_008232 [Choristoneura fumiferana]
MKFLLIVASVVAVAVAGPTRALVTPGGAGPAPVIVDPESPISVGPALIESPVAVGPVYVESPISAGPALVEGEAPISVGPVYIENPISVGPALVEGEAPISVGPVYIESPISVGPALVEGEAPISVGPAVIGGESPIAVGPAFIEHPMVDDTPVNPAPVPAPIEAAPASGTPLVQIILNINHAVAETPALVPAPVLPEVVVEEPVHDTMPVIVVDEAAEDVNVAENPIDGVAIVPAPIVIEPTPIELPTPELPAPAPAPVELPAPELPAVNPEPVAILPDVLN